jgi:predicted GNAT family N-acyltransferase
MATATDLQGRGLGDELLAAGCERARAAGAAYVWARARVTAERFYLHRGFLAVGDVYIDDTTGLEHRDVTFDLLR